MFENWVADIISWGEASLEQVAPLQHHRPGKKQRHQQEGYRRREAEMGVVHPVSPGMRKMANKYQSPG